MTGFSFLVSRPICILVIPSSWAAGRKNPQAPSASTAYRACMLRLLALAFLALASLLACGRAPVPAAATAAPAAAVRPDSGLVVSRLAEGVYAVVRREPPAVINESNSLFVVGDDGVLVVDAQSSAARTRETLAALRRITRKPVRTLVNTHWHDDHVVGNAVWRDNFPGLEIVGGTTNAEDMAADGVKFRKAGVAGRTGTIGFLEGLVAKRQSFLGGPLAEEERLSHLSAARLLVDYSNADTAFLPLVPTRTVADSLVLGVGRRTVVVRFLGRGHTRGDLVVWLPRERILAAGDLVMNPVTFVGSTSFPIDFAMTVDSLRALAPRVVVPGHGALLAGDAATEHLLNLSYMLHSLATQARAAVARGETLEQAKRSIDLAPFERVIAGDSPVRRVLFSYYVTGSAIPRAWQQATEERASVTR